MPKLINAEKERTVIGMAEYIEREALRDALYNADAITMNGVKILNQFPAANVAQVKHGRWVIPTKIGHHSFDIPHCSVCNGIPCGVDENTNYCPNCGAKMGGDNNDD